MCGRFSVFTFHEIRVRSNFQGDFSIEPRYNVAPSHEVDLSKSVLARSLVVRLISTRDITEDYRLYAMDRTVAERQ
jgi:hypothetical protein